MQFNITKFIPFEIRIKTLYWVNLEREIKYELERLYEVIDNGDVKFARMMLNDMLEKWEPIGIDCPKWFWEYIAKFQNADSMISFLED